MVEICGKSYEVVDAHAHVWNNYNGMRFGNTPIEKIGNGRIRVGKDEMDFIPAEFTDYKVLVEYLEAYMTFSGVDRACILQNPCYGDQREYVGEIVKKNPKKFVSFGKVDPRDRDTVVSQIDDLMDNYGNIGIKLEIPDVPFKMDDPSYDFMWKYMQDKDGIVAMDLGWGTGKYDFNIEELTNVVKKYPKMKLMLCHMGVSRLWDLNQKYPYPYLTKTLKLLDTNKDNLYLDMAMVPQANVADEYPFYRGQEIMRYVKSFCGFDRIMWGSDFPSVLLHCTYKQSLDFVTKCCPFLTEDDLAGILGKNAIRFLFKDETEGRGNR